MGCSSSPPPPLATVISGATVYDGSGNPGRLVSVRIAGERIVDVGDIVPGAGDWFFDGTGLVLAPGFIDTHSHADRGLFDHPDALAAVSQGITTIVVGQDGGSPFPLGDFFTGLDSAPAAVNVASYVGHGTLRRMVLGDDYRRPATKAEIDSMRTLLYQALDAGGLGLSTGLEYDPGIYADYAELLSLTQTVSAEGGRYISHIRSEDRAFWDALDEIIRLGRDAGVPVQISHLKLAMRGLWNQADSLIAVLDRARAEGIQITADIYPYTYWQSTLTVLFPERDYTNRAAAQFALDELAPAEGLVLSRFDPDSSYVGMTLADIARQRKTDPATTLMALIQETHGGDEDSRESVIATSMVEADVVRLLAWPWANVCTDGELSGRHPRGFGAFVRILGRYVGPTNVLTLEEALRKMSSLAARNLGIEDRGVIREGAYADLVLFHPDSVGDRATLDDPHATASGIRSVWVNGELVYDGGQPTGRRPGQVIRSQR
ncbi:MAG: D-aminoacylase [Gemmatimonadales bacterium]|nr:MAG: D-aminoacylase [Gemmatimonadales bacterium]